MSEPREPSDRPNHEEIEIFVDGKAVKVEPAEQTGLSIKEAAIRQGVQIDKDFALWIEKGGSVVPLGDDQGITVHPGERFVATPNDREIEIIVNEKPVVVIGHKQTGETVKAAAIQQKVPIQLDFVLSIELGGGKTELVGDDQIIRVHKDERFLAIPNDDNS